MTTSTFFDDLSASLSVPAVYGADEHADSEVWIWTEEVHDDAAPWDEGRFLHLAARVGQFSGAYLAGTPLPTNRSLCPDFARSWVRTVLAFYPYLTDSDDRRWFWEHPTMIGMLGKPRDHPLLAFVDDLDRHLVVLRRLPQTLCHRDLWKTNVLGPRPTAVW